MSVRRCFRGSTFNEWVPCRVYRYLTDKRNLSAWWIVWYRQRWDALESSQMHAKGRQDHVSDESTY